MGGKMGQLNEAHRVAFWYDRTLLRKSAYIVIRHWGCSRFGRILISKAARKRRDCAYDFRRLKFFSVACFRLDPRLFSSAKGKEENRRLFKKTFKGRDRRGLFCLGEQVRKESSPVVKKMSQLRGAAPARSPFLRGLRAQFSFGCRRVPQQDAAFVRTGGGAREKERGRASLVIDRRMDFFNRACFIRFSSGQARIPLRPKAKEAGQSIPLAPRRFVCALRQR